MNGAGGRTLRYLLAGLVAALALLPIATWIPGGYTAHVWYETLEEWWSGSLIVGGVGAILVMLSRRNPRLWTDGRWTRLVERLAIDTPRGSLILAGVAAAVYTIVSQVVNSARPLLIDEVVQVWQARLYAAGQLWTPSPGYLELYGVQNVVDHGGKVFSQFPAGGPAMLALGALIGAEWLVGPVFAALGVWWWGATLRRFETSQVVRTSALLVLAFAPFVVFMSASHMNHVTAMTWILGGVAGLAVVVTSERPRPLVALGLGLAFGLAATIRPVDAFAFGAPAGGWLFYRAIRERGRVLECGVAALGMALPIAAMLAVNAATTGEPFLFGYSVLWGEAHGLGFHPVPWGPPHTPVRGIEYLNIYLLHLQIRLLESPVPALLPALVILAVGPRLHPIERYLMIGSAMILGFYWAYWHHGFYLGPRFLYLLVPVIALLTARFGPWLRERTGPGSIPVRSWVFGGIVAALLALAVNIPLRAKQYGNAFLSSRWPVEDDAVRAGATNALVLVRESWGAQVIERMWGVGIGRGEAEFIYHRADMCAIETTLGDLERRGLAGPPALAALLAITGDSLRLVDSLSVDPTARFLPGVQYSPTCLARLRDDFAGFTVFPPLLFDDRSGNVYVHDQHARDTIALMRHPERPIFLLTPDDTSRGSPVRFRPVRRDSLLQAWGLPADWRPGPLVP